MEPVSVLAHGVNPHVAVARVHLGEWARGTGLVTRASALARFESADFAWFAAAVHPRATLARLELMCDWFAWLFLVDDQLDDGGLGRDLDRTRQLRQQLRLILDDRASRPDTTTAVASALADLWQRTSSGASLAWRSRFADHLDRCLDAAATWEAGNRVRGLVPDESTYIEKRRHTGAIYVCMDLVEVAEGVEMERAAYDSAQCRGALDAACDVVCWTNDLYSLAKERGLGEVHNLVHVVATHRGWSTEQARDHVCAAIDGRTAHYLRLEQDLLAAYPGDPAVSALAAGMRSWISGNQAWSRRTRRYATASRDLPSAYLERDAVQERK